MPATWAASRVAGSLGRAVSVQEDASHGMQVDGLAPAVPGRVARSRTGRGSGAPAMVTILGLDPPGDADAGADVRAGRGTREEAGAAGADRRRLLSRRRRGMDGRVIGEVNLVALTFAPHVAPASFDRKRPPGAGSGGAPARVEIAGLDSPRRRVVRWCRRARGPWRPSRGRGRWYVSAMRCGRRVGGRMCADVLGCYRCASTAASSLSLKPHN